MLPYKPQMSGMNVRFVTGPFCPTENLIWIGSNRPEKVGDETIRIIECFNALGSPRTHQKDGC
jgi:hypothetical protein